MQSSLAEPARDSEPAWHPETRAELPSPLAWRALRRARQGDRSARDFLYVRYGQEVYECMLSALGDELLAGEITWRVFASIALAQ